jgi:anhydro-N-acetylmuramic acid kinase
MPDANLVEKPGQRVIGLMSGTSCDGVDLALIEISGSGLETRFKVQGKFHQPYSEDQKQFLLQCMDPRHSNVKVISQANFLLAGIWAGAIDSMLRHYGEKAADIDLIGSHGQTVYHQPQREDCQGLQVNSTLQIGDPSVLAQLTGITTVGDFRVADMAAGGQGAPLVPFFDWLFFSRFQKNMLILNIGGIANITYIPSDGDRMKVKAFDTGPGNMLIDQMMQRLYELPYDHNGAKASLGKRSDKLFAYLQKQDTFPDQPPPKSTGREHYGQDFVLSLLRKAIRWRIPEPDVLHTVTEYTAYTVWKAYRDFIGVEIESLVAGGGGSHNSFLLKRLQEFFTKIPVENVNHYGVDEDFKEAICFAVLAHECIQGNPANLTAATGAKRNVVLGKICPVNKS